MPWICVDAGTSVIKAVLFDRQGRELALSRQSVPVTRPSARYSEQDMTAVWEAVVCACREVAQRSPAGVEGIVTTAQGDGCWLVNEAGKPVGPAILWNDGRAHEIVEGWRGSGAVEAAFRDSGSVTYPGLANAILRWLDEHDRARLSQARWLLSCNGWLYLQLTGQIAADLSDASNPFSDVEKREYSPELIRLFEAEAYAHLLPEISAGQSPVAALRTSTAQLLGVPTGIPVVMAPYDIVTTAIGSGCTEAGEGCLILGTTICPEVITTDSGRDGTPTGTTIALNQPGRYLRAMPTLTGCEALDWATGMLRANGVEELSQMAAASVPGARGVTCLPYFSPAGERSPFLAPSARASFMGLSLTHSREDMARAIFEGLCLIIRDCFAAATPVPLSRIAVCGGGSRSEFWCQLIADACGCEVARPCASEIGARGAFFCALLATGKAVSLREAVEQCGDEARLYTPSAAETAVYDELFERFMQLRQAVTPTW